MKNLHLRDFVLLFVLIDVGLKLCTTIDKSLRNLTATSLGYFASFERFLKLDYTLFLVIEIVSVVIFFLLKEIDLSPIKFFY